jgi:hypothetical protein
LPVPGDRRVTIDAHASFALKTLKCTSGLPLNYARFGEPLHSADADDGDAR